MGVSFSQKQVVLLVEDEALVRMFAADVLGEHGYKVIEAANASEAMLLLQARPDIQVMITDVDMPGGMDGFQLASTVREQSLNLEIIVMSGRAWPGEGDMSSGSVFLAKPCPAATLLDQVNQAAARAQTMVAQPFVIAVEATISLEPPPALPAVADGEQIVVDTSVQA